MPVAVAPRIVVITRNATWLKFDASDISIKPVKTVT